MQNRDLRIVAVGKADGISKGIAGIFGKVGWVKDFLDFRDQFAASLKKVASRLCYTGWRAEV
jgi:hypothetical protein